MTTMLVAVWWSAGALAAECLPLTAARIRAADLASAEPAFAALNPDQAITYGPSPGARRHLTAVEVRRLAQRHGVNAPQAPAICFEYPVAPLTESAVLAAIRKALDNNDARVELIDFSRQPAPAGEILFARSSLSTAPGGALLWRGRLRYAERRSVPVWARVRIGIERTRVVAAEQLPAGRPIREDQLRIERAEVSPLEQPALALVTEAAGAKPRRTIERGQPLAAALLVAPRAIEPGDRVEVKVSSGAAHLRLDALAESGGRAGDRILLRNPDNSRRFQARVEKKGQATVIASNGKE